MDAKNHETPWVEMVRLLWPGEKPFTEWDAPPWRKCLTLLLKMAPWWLILVDLSRIYQLKMEMFRSSVNVYQRLKPILFIVKSSRHPGAPVLGPGGWSGAAQRRQRYRRQSGGRKEARPEVWWMDIASTIINTINVLNFHTHIYIIYTYACVVDIMIP